MLTIWGFQCILRAERRLQMDISLTPEMENQVVLKVASGLYTNASEVVRESLRLLLERDAMRQRLRVEVNLGYEQLARGEGTAVTTESEFLNLAKATFRKTSADRNPGTLTVA